MTHDAGIPMILFYDSAYANIPIFIYKYIFNNIKNVYLILLENIIFLE